MARLGLAGPVGLAGSLTGSSIGTSTGILWGMSKVLSMMREVGLRWTGPLKSGYQDYRPECGLELDRFTASGTVNRDLLGRFTLERTSSEDFKCKAITS